jgi:hypothetical protein
LSTDKKADFDVAISRARKSVREADISRYRLFAEQMKYNNVLPNTGKTGGIPTENGLNHQLPPQDDVNLFDA